MKKKSFRGWLPLIIFFLMMVVTALVQRHFGQPWSGICAFVTYGGYLLYALLNKKRVQKENEEELAKLEAEMAALEEAEGFDPATMTTDGDELPFLLVHHNFNARYYQVFRSTKAYRFVHVGNEFKGIDPDRLLDECPTETRLAELKNSFSIRKEDVRRFTVEIKKSAMATPVPTSGVITFYAPKKQRYDLLFDVTPQQAERFFSDLRDRTEKKERAYHRQERKNAANLSLGEWRTENQNPKTFKVLKTVTMMLTVAGAAVSLAFFFLPLPYKPTAWVLTVLALICLLLSLIFPAYYSLVHTSEEAKQAEDAACIGYLAPMIACNIGLALRTLMDFNFLNEWILFAVGGSVGAVLTVIYTLRSREMQWKIGRILGALFLMFYVGLGLPGQLNYLLDTSETVIEERVVLDMHISTSSKGPDSYYCTVELQGREVDVDVGREAYATIAVGDTVEVGTKRGAFGMAYCQILIDN